uniref:UBN2 domain-containing protein n=1 Tax=Manihot esculenta TaxID=3983 RepID=A0A2C9U3R4_MANES
MASSSNSTSIPAPLIEADIKAWQKIIKGTEISLVIGGTREKTKEEYNDANWKKISINAKVLNIHHCALDVTEYNCVLDCESAKELWDKFEVTYEGTNQVKESKANLLVRDFKLFEMKLDENIVKMSTRFTDLINLLKAFRKSFEEAELVKNVTS